MLPGRTYSLAEIGRILMRRWWLVLLPFAIGTGAGVVAYTRVPAQYRSETLIMVVPQRIPDNYVKPTVTTDVGDRLRSISEQIMSRSRLERIIQDFDLYKELRAVGVMEDVVQRMRDDIDIALEGRAGRESSFRVTYSSSDAKVAQNVTERLASLFIEENLRERGNLADSTNQFLDSQLQDAKRLLIAQEKKLEAYSRRYSGQLPSQLTGNLQAIQALQMQMQSLAESMNRSRERRLLVERQLADARTLPADMVAPAPAGASPEGAASAPLAQRLEAARSRLESFKRRYTPDHPDVVALEGVIRDLQGQVDEEANRPSDEEKPLSRTELARNKRIADLQADLQMIDRQLAAAQLDDVRLKRTMGEYQARIEGVPTRESELVELTRDYSTLQETYSSLLLKREDSKLAANLERRQIGEQFRVLDPASLPERPYNRKQQLGLLAGGPLSGLALGLFLVAFLEYRDSGFRTEDDILRVLSIPVLALIPEMADADAGRRSKRRDVPRLGGSVKLPS